jgi:ectoine hydroxylase-related dioxygenase (phytanoyl-CoA dioxygenase family)
MTDRIVEEMNRDGYSILKGVVNSDILSEIQNNLDSIYQKDHERFGSDFLMQINELEVVRNVLEYHDVFARLLDETNILDEAIEALLHPFAIIHNYNLIRLFPDIKTKMLGHQWHRDVYYFGPGIRTAVNVMIPLHKTTVQNGATEVIPGSHWQKELPSEQYISEKKIAAELEAGDILFCDAATFHAAGKNQTEGHRTIVVLKYTLSFFTQQYDFCRMLDMNKYSERIKNRLGWNVRVPDSLENFRVTADKRMYKWPIRY